MARPSKIKLRFVEPSRTQALTFSEALGGRESVYRTMLLEAVQSGKVIEVAKDDKYPLVQFKTQAKKLKLRLLFAKDGDSLFIKALRLEGDQHRLFLLLREPRTFAELEGKKLELDLKTTLASMVAAGTVEKKTSANGDRYALSRSGLQQIAQ